MRTPGAGVLAGDAIVLLAVKSHVRRSGIALLRSRVVGQKKVLAGSKMLHPDDTPADAEFRTSPGHQSPPPLWTLTERVERVWQHS